ncbi:MAG: hypothetical protein H8K04_05395 [Nitrospira sp.]
MLDSHNREVIGYQFALLSHEKEAELAVESACLLRFGTLRLIGVQVLSNDTFGWKNLWRDAFLDWKISDRLT